MNQPNQPSAGDMFAFPCTEETFTDRGMTLLDYFAAKAMNGILCSPKTFGEGAPLTEKTIAQGAYAIAEAMIAERQFRAALAKPAEQGGKEAA